MGDVIKVDFDVYTTEQVVEFLTPIFEKVAASRGYDASRAREFVAAIVAARKQMKAYGINAVVTGNPQKDFEHFANKLVDHCWQVLATVAANELCYPKQ